MDSRWFLEDREKTSDRNEQAEAKRESEKALKNSTLFKRRLKAILELEMEQSLKYEEDFENPNWERIHVSEISRRKTLRQIIKLIDF